MVLMTMMMMTKRMKIMMKMMMAITMAEGNGWKRRYQDAGDNSCSVDLRHRNCDVFIFRVIESNSR